MNNTPRYQEIIAGADYSAGAIVPVKLTDKERKLTVGCFYWVRVKLIGTPDDGAWEPARFTGIDFSHHPTWDFIGEDSSIGHHHVEVVDVGDVLVRSEAVERESDALYRNRLIGAIGRMNELDAAAVSTASGFGLDTIGVHVGLLRGGDVAVTVE